MRTLRLVVAWAILLGFAGCGSDKNQVMPDVTGKRLDVAKSAITDAGFEDEVKVDGGGVFGIINESNWEVCDQSPAAGETVSDAPQLTVGRSCDNGGGQTETAESTTTSSETSETDAAGSSEPHAAQVLTTNN